MVDQDVRVESHFILQLLCLSIVLTMFRFYLQGFYLFWVSRCVHFSHLYGSAVVPASVAWVIYHTVKWAILAFNFQKETKSSQMVDAMASSIAEGSFGNYPSSLQGQGVFLACQKCLQVSPQLFVFCAFTVNVYVEVQFEHLLLSFIFSRVTWRDWIRCVSISCTSLWFPSCALLTSLSICAIVLLSFQTCRTILQILFSSRVISPHMVKRKSGHGGSISITLNVITLDNQTWWLIRMLYLGLVRWDIMKVMGICFGLVT